MFKPPARKESSIERSVVAWAKAHGIFYCYKLNGTGKDKLDRMFMIPGGRPLIIEFKRFGEKPTPLQKKTIHDLSAINYDVEVHDTRAGAIAAIQRCLDAAQLPATGG
jgi:hypothetical protein